MSKKITKDTPIAQVASNPDLADILVQEVGLFCVGCPMAQLETIQQGCQAHGLTDKEIKKLLAKLNQKKN